MAKIESFEDLEIWKEARALTNEIYWLTTEGSFMNDYGLQNQIRKSAGSVMDNIAEGFERGGNREFIQFLFVAKGSCGELRSQIYQAKDRNHISEDKFLNLLTRTEVLSNKISGLIKYLKNSDFKGNKYVNEPLEDYTLNLEP